MTTVLMYDCWNIRYVQNLAHLIGIESKFLIMCKFILHNWVYFPKTNGNKIMLFNNFYISKKQTWNDNKTEINKGK